MLKFHSQLKDEMLAVFFAHFFLLFHVITNIKYYLSANNLVEVFTLVVHVHLLDGVLACSKIIN